MFTEKLATCPLLRFGPLSSMQRTDPDFRSKEERLHTSSLCCTCAADGHTCYARFPKPSCEVGEPCEKQKRLKRFLVPLVRSTLAGTWDMCENLFSGFGKNKRSQTVTNASSFLWFTKCVNSKALCEDLLISSHLIKWKSWNEDDGGLIRASSFLWFTTCVRACIRALLGGFVDLFTY